MDNRQQVLRWTRIPNAKVIGYPRIEKWKFYWDSTLDEFQFRVLADTIDMEDPKADPLKKNRTEIIIDHNEQPPQVKQRIAVDQQLIEKRTQIATSFKNKLLAKNVIFIFIDSLSRDNFKRKLVKTRDWLETRYNNKTSDGRVYQL